MISHTKSPLPEDIHFIVEQILLSPSGDNTQPWRLVVDGNSIELWYTAPKDFLPALFWKSVDGRTFTYLTFGILIENATIAASSRGYRVTTLEFPEKNEPLCIAKLVLTKDSSVTQDPLFTALAKRETNRKPYTTTPLRSPDREALKHIGADKNYNKLLLLERGEEMDICSMLIGHYEKVLFSNKYLHQRFFSLINWTKKIDRERRSGFYILSLGSALFSIVGLWFLQFWWLTRIGNVFGLEKFIAKEQQSTYKKASAFGLIHMPKGADVNWIQVGRYLERVWLTATNCGLSFQPMSGSLLLKSIADTKEGELLLTQKERKALLEDYNAVLYELGIEDSELSFMFRIGYTGETTPKTLRRGFSDVVEIKQS